MKKYIKIYIFYRTTVQLLLNAKLLTRRLKLEIQGADLTDSYLQTDIYKLAFTNC